MSGPLLSIRGVGKSYGDRLVLDGVSFDVQPGEFVALLGRSGAGKSTLFRCLTRLIRADQGEIVIAGRPLHDLRGGELVAARREIGLIFQQFNLVRRISALGNVLAGRLGHVSTWRAVLRSFPDADRQIALAALDRVGLPDHASQRADRLSGGQQQRVAIARVLAQQSRLILADEPVASLDPESAASALSTLRDVARERGIGVLCSLHQVDYAVAYADRIVGLKDGRVVADHPAARFAALDLAGIYRTLAQPAENVAQTENQTALKVV